MVYDAQLARMRGDADGRHEEWLLDDGIADTFSASDPVSHGQPGSIVNLRYAAWTAMKRRAGARRAPGWALVVGALVVLTWLAVRKRGRGDDRLDSDRRQ